MVEATAKTNSVTIHEGIKLAAFLSSSFRSAPSSDCTNSILAEVSAEREDSVPLCLELGSKHQASRHDGSADPIRHQDDPLRHI
jgi:hypothetical protein